MSLVAPDALRDPSTGLPTRPGFAALLAEVLVDAAIAGGVTVLVLDVDRFKDVNDAFGPAVGDELLLALPDRLRGALAPGDQLGRFAGDEFAVACPGVADEREAGARAERLLAALAAPFMIDEHQLFLTASVGVVIAEPATHTAETLVRDAEVAMHRAKEQGGARHVLFDQAMLRRVVDRVGLQHDLRRALEQDEFVLYFQPIVSVGERRIVALEALVRWQHPELGLVPPSAFIPVAEDSGLIVGLGRWVLTEACRQLARWSDEPGIDLPYVSVNLSGRQLVEPGLPEEVGEILRRTGVPAERVALELTESVLMSSTASPTAVLQRLEALGVQLLLDDFGTGYSSLNHLKRFPITGMKVDRSFIAGITEGEEDRHILEAILRMADALGLSVVAEGVETVEQAQLLSGLGCRALQGYLFSAPVPAAAIETLLRSGLPLDRLGPAFAMAAPRPAAPKTPEADDGPTVALGEAAQALSISISTLRRWDDSGRIASVRTPGGHRRFSVAELRRLNQTVTGAAAPVVRTVAAPGGPLPALGALLVEAPRDLSDAAVRALYDGQRLGWFAGDAAAPELDRFLAAAARAARAADWPGALAASERLLLLAHYAGASLLERHTFVERLGDVAVRGLTQRDAPRSEIVGARRLFARLAQALLEQPLS